MLLSPGVEAEQGSSPLEPFSRLIGGEWHSGGSYQVFEWAVGKSAVKSRAYFWMNSEAQLVSEGSWYWHPGDQAIRGQFTAVNMPIVLFDYSTWFETNRMISDLRAYDKQGNELRYEEVWDFVSDDQYEWTLYRIDGSGRTKEMSATYQRR